MPKNRGNLGVQFRKVEGNYHVRVVYRGPQGRQTVGRGKFTPQEMRGVDSECAKWLAGLHPKIRLSTEV